jgi:hypothetical protein
MLVVPVLALAGCSDGTGPGGISENDAQLIASEVVSASIGALNSGTAAGAVQGFDAVAASASSVPVPLRFDYSHTESCPLFGRVGVTGIMSGSMDSETGDGVLWLQVTETLTDCTFDSENGDLVINGAPSITLTGNFTFLGGVPATTQSLTLSGGFRWQFDEGNSTFCALSLTMSIAYGGTGSTTVSGTVCGYPVNF